MSKRIIDRIKRAVREDRFEVTEHAVEEAEADGFSPLDIRAGLLGCRFRRVLFADHDIWLVGERWTGVKYVWYADSLSCVTCE